MSETCTRHRALPRRFPAFCLLAAIQIPAVSFADDVAVEWRGTPDRVWVGAACWANPMEDWRVREDAAENYFTGGCRNVVLLTGEITDPAAGFVLETNIHAVEPGSAEDGFVGVCVGIQGEFDDYRDSAVHGEGLYAGMTLDGRLFVGAAADDAPKFAGFRKPMTLRLVARGANGQITLELSAESDRECAKMEPVVVDASRLGGLVSLVSSSKRPQKAALDAPRGPKAAALDRARGPGPTCRFSSFRLAGEGVKARPERAFGPIAWTTHTLSTSGDLRLLVQMMPLEESAGPIELVLDEKLVATERLDGNARTALLTATGVDVSKNHVYEVRYKNAGQRESTYRGSIRAIPTNRPITVASMSCNDSTGFPHNLLVENVMSHHPDVVTFLGDQIYEGVGGYGLVMGDGDRAVVCYLRKYLLHGWTWRELLRDIPSVTIPDDHDVFHGNLWGAGGKRADMSLRGAAAQQDSGGYKLPVPFVNAVHRTQTGNLPPGRDAESCPSGVSVYFTSWSYGPMDFAILADRQFKSAPRAMFPEARIVNGWPDNREWDAKTKAVHPDAQLLGPRQERFLAEWADHPAPGARFRVVLSQSPFVELKTLPRGEKSGAVIPSLPIYKSGDYAPDDRQGTDFDSNAWPRSGRDAAVRLMARARALHIAGDQHLGSTGRYGIEGFRDGPWWIATPAIANLWPRRWMPAEAGADREPGAPRYTGHYEDLFGNRFNVRAVANPMDVDREPGRLFDRAVGYTICTFDPSKGRATLANWPYWSSPTRPAPDNRPFDGWPIDIEP